MISNTDIYHFIISIAMEDHESFDEQIYCKIAVTKPGLLVRNKAKGWRLSVFLLLRLLCILIIVMFTSVCMCSSISISEQLLCLSRSVQ